MRISRTLLGLAAVIAGLTAAARADSLTGRWDAGITLNGTAIPFRLDISGDGANLKGTLFNGDQLQTTTGAHFENGKIVLEFDHYLTKISAALPRKTVFSSYRVVGERAFHRWCLGDSLR